MTHAFLLWALTLCPVLRTLVYCTGWSLLRILYSDDFSTKLHLRFPESACLENVLKCPGFAVRLGSAEILRPWASVSVAHEYSVVFGKGPKFSGSTVMTGTAWNR